MRDGKGKKGRMAVGWCDKGVMDDSVLTGMCNYKKNVATFWDFQKKIF